MLNNFLLPQTDRQHEQTNLTNRAEHTTPLMYLLKGETRTAAADISSTDTDTGRGAAARRLLWLERRATLSPVRCIATILCSGYTRSPPPPPKEPQVNKKCHVSLGLGNPVCAAASSRLR